MGWIVPLGALLLLIIALACIVFLWKEPEG
jgi:hypothetical protein